MILNSDQQLSLEGVLWSARGPWLVLRHVTKYEANEPPVPLDGEAIVHRDQVAFLQVP